MSVRDQLSQTLHLRPTGLAIGAVCGAGAGLVTAITTSSKTLFWSACLLIALAAIRVGMAYGARSLQGSLGDWLRYVYPAGALAYAAIAGFTAAMAIHHATNPDLQVLLVGYALLFGAGIAVGNAGRPLIALGQMGLTFLPIVVASLVNGSPPYLVLAAILPTLTIGLSIVTLNVFSTLSRQVRSARRNAELAEHLHLQSRTDIVTGLLNRTGFSAEAKQVLGRADPDARIALFWLDMHRFKEVNDSLGHKMGDKVLKETAHRLRALTAPGAVLARFGSDEFLLLDTFASAREAENLAGLLSSEMAAPMRLGGHRIESGASIGMTSRIDGEQTLDEMMQQADLALYHAKAAGRHQICQFAPSMTRILVRRKEIEAELRAAIQRDELSIYFQPILDLSSGRIRSFEALVRWFHPEKGELAPEEFIPVAEETGLIITLGNWITRQAALACAKWPNDITVAVNLSPIQIKAPGAALGILRALDDAGLSPERLQLEVTESLFLEDDESTAAFMDQLSGEGVRFALDDFGTGYSSLHYINKYPFRTIKVDRSFVSGPNIGRHSDAIIRAVAEMGSTLGMEIVAEGLETVEQVQIVRRAGCTLGQGYYFSRAVPEHMAAILLTEEADRLGLTRLAS
ncbi:EAL domain-containing protein [Altererythrobacter aestuarii]|uniref:EAL domain-containing protein n=2 Tax=Alteraurantiacibacter aestuarii TaxID=650004 RepID=A0A844ZJ24_9SPHN|nr:EAL domain-containing protein [Alteraurantiacibacter aestuarii]MXO87785.1 EAL domain-containing protein [Alteraurantiacibacter aestuarii]